MNTVIPQAANTCTAPMGAPALAELDRLALLPTHPVITRGFRIPTPPLKRAIRTQIHLIATGAPAGSWVALPRFGKSYGAEYCHERLAEAFPQLPIFCFHAHHDQRPSEREFYADLLAQSGFGSHVQKVAPREVRSRLVRVWWAEAGTKGARSLVFIGDEMQCLREEAYSWMIDISNDLHALDVRMISLLFGQPELIHLRSSFKQQDRGDILGRFLSRMYAFEGIRSATELCEVMCAYDDYHIRDYPEGSGVSFTRFFFPEAFAAGWRLASCATQCWAAFCEVAAASLKSAHHVEQLNIGMEWIAGAIQHVLTHNTDLDSPKFRLREKDWQEAIDISGFASSLTMTYRPEGLRL